MVLVILLISIFIGVSAYYLIVPNTSKVEEQRAKNTDRHDQLFEKITNEFKEIAKERNKIIEKIININLPDSVYSAELLKTKTDVIDSCFTGDLVKIKTYIDDLKLRFNDIKCEYTNSDIYDIDNIKNVKSIPIQHQIKLKDGRVTGVNTASVLAEAERIHDYMLLKHKTVVSVEILGLFMLDYAVKRNHLQYHINRDTLEKLGVFQTITERDLTIKLVTISDKIDMLTSAFETHSSILFQTFGHLEANLIQIGESLSAINSSSKAQNLLMMYNIYETQKIRNSLN